MSIDKVKILALSAIITFPAISMAAVEGQIGSIKRLLTDTEKFGHCMIFTTIESSIDCPNNWFSIDCKGSFNSKETTRRLWDSAQLAFATDSRVYLVANDQKKHNGYCVADRLDARND